MLILKTVKVLHSEEKVSAKGNAYKVHKCIVDDCKSVDGTVYPGTKVVWLSSSQDFEFRNKEGVNFVFVNQSKYGSGFYITMMAM